MIYSVAILCLIGITSCQGHWIENQKTSTYNKQKWNIDSDFYSVSPKENDLDFHSTYEVIDTVPADFSKINKYLGKSITLDFSPQEFDKSEISKLEEEIEQIKSSTPSIRVDDERRLVPIREQVDDVQPTTFLLADTSRPALISREVMTPTAIREDNTRPLLIRKDNTPPPAIRKAYTRPVIHKYNTKSPISRQDYTELNARPRSIFDYERKHRYTKLN